MFARVAFPAAIPIALTYAVPENLRSVVVPGIRVRAPLRRAQRVGLVVAVSEESALGGDAPLPLSEALDVEPLVPDHILELAVFAADYYSAPIGMVLRSALPAALLQTPPPMLHAGERARELIAGATTDEAALLERVLRARRISLVTLKEEGWAGDRLARLVAELEPRHGVRLVQRLGGEHAGTVTAVALTDLDDVQREALIGRAPAQRRAVEWLAVRGHPALESEVVSAAGCSGAVVSELVRKGLVRRFRQRRATATTRWELPAAPAPTTLTVHQAAALRRLEETLAAGVYRATLLLGVTGSGKTEVYLRLASAVVAAGRQALVLVPEIALTPALAGHLRGRFGERVAVVHSGMAEGERLRAWHLARTGALDVVAGPRSALWLPLPRPGVIVVDEEQDSSYKQEEDPRYNARDLALALGQRLAVPVVLASATPSLEALWLAERGKLEVLELPERVAGGSLPRVEVIDLTREPPEAGEHGRRILSRPLRQALTTVLERDEQAILLVNRRGWAPVLLCRECGHQAACRDCSIPLTVHRREQALRCHYCGFSRDVPDRCPRCSGEVLEDVGAGTEKVAALVERTFPQARVAILDRDTVRSPAALVGTLNRFARGDTNVLVGTQLVSKGHHFPRVTLTGVINADNLLGFPDFRGAERTFQLLTQVAGRAGRGAQPGLVVVQTYHPDHYAIRAAVKHDVREFVAEELRFRRAFRYPPCSRLVVVRFESTRQDAAHACAAAAADALSAGGGSVRVVGPAPAPLERLRGRWRVQMLLLSSARGPLREAVARVLAVPLPGDVHRVVDVDALNTT